MHIMLSIIILALGTLNGAQFSLNRSLSYLEGINGSSTTLNALHAERNFATCAVTLQIADGLLH